VLPEIKPEEDMDGQIAFNLILEFEEI